MWSILKDLAVEVRNYFSGRRSWALIAVSPSFIVVTFHFIRNVYYPYYSFDPYTFFITYLCANCFAAGLSFGGYLQDDTYEEISKRPNEVGSILATRYLTAVLVLWGFNAFVACLLFIPYFIVGLFWKYVI